jgi:hypothetical protein
MSESEHVDTADDQSPIPFSVELPSPLWSQVDPASVGVTNTLMLAKRTGLGDDYVPTIAVSGGWRVGVRSLEAVADESIAKLRAEGAEDVELIGRHLEDSATAPVVTQTIGATAGIDGRRYDLRQSQVVFGYLDLQHPERTAVLVHTLSCTYAQAPAMVAEFKDYVASVTVVPEQV